MAHAVRRRGPQARGRATHARLLEAAEDLFTRLGYDATTVSDVAAQAGVGVGTLYHHFPDKRALLLELIDSWGERVAAERRTDLEFDRLLGDDPRAGIAGFLQSGYDRLRKKPSIYLVVLALADRDAEVGRRYERIAQVGIERLTALIELGQRRGLMRAETDARAAGFLIHHAIDMAATQLLVREVVDRDPERVLEELAEMISRYILEDRA